MRAFTDDCLTDRSILVTGGSSGIGRAVCIAIAQSGGRVIATGRNLGQLEVTVSALPGKNHVALAYELSGVDETADWVRNSASEHGALSGIFHGAGIELTRPARLTKHEHVADVFAAAVYGAFGIARAGAQKGVLTDRASLIFMSSVAGSRGQSGMSVYSAAKAAVDGLVRSLSCEFAGRMIRVNAIAGGAVQTEMHDRLTNALSTESLAAYSEKHLLGFGTAEDIACAAIFLLSDASRWITGTTLVVDGGYMVR